MKEVPQTDELPAFLPFLTYIGHFGYSGAIGPIQESRLVVVDVLDLDDELGLGLQRPVGQPVAGLGPQDIL